MTEEQAVKLFLDYYNSLFPKRCSCCGNVYYSYKEFLLKTESIGKPLSYDSKFNSGEKKIAFKFFGVLTCYNCKCGTTLTLSTKKMNILKFMKLMYWGRSEAKKRNLKFVDLIVNIRCRVRKEAIGSQWS